MERMAIEPRALADLRIIEVVGHRAVDGRERRSPVGQKCDGDTPFIAAMLALSRQGLGERRIVGCKGKTETRFLDDLDEIAASGRTRAEDLLQLYDTSWNHDVKRVFRDFAY